MSHHDPAPTDGTPPTPANTQAEPNPRRWLALVFIGLAQLMIVLDVTIVNIALPSAQADLEISDGDRQWVITAYTLAFGSLLLLGGRIADYTGRRRAFLIGLLGFAVASALGGAAGSFGVLLAARALQGVFAALLAPTALSLLAVTFTGARERGKAFGIFAAIAAGGSAVGLLVGGALTEYLDWRWCLYVNVPIAVVAALSWYVFPKDTPAVERARFDVFGVLFAVSGLVAVVYACSEAEAEGWGSGLVLGLLGLGVLLLAVFVWVETRVAHPLLPMWVLLNRTRGSAYLAVALSVVGTFGIFLLLTYYMQGVKDYSAMLTGVAFLPLTFSILAGAGGISGRLLPKVPPRVLVIPGLLTAAAGLAWLGQLEADSSYAGTLLPALILVGLGLGLVVAPAINYATHGVHAQDTGIASATVNTAQQIGGTVGTALLNTIATSATASYLEGRPKNPRTLHDGLAEGFATAFTWSAAILVVAAIVVTPLMNTRRPEPDGLKAQDQPAPAPAHQG